MNGLDRKEWVLAHEAAEWLGKLEECGLETNEAFSQWISASPLHVKAFLIATSVDRLLDDIDPHKRIDVLSSIADAPAVVALRDAAITPTSTHSIAARPTKGRKRLR